jgi:hypothetical protein
MKFLHVYFCLELCITIALWKNNILELRQYTIIYVKMSNPSSQVRGRILLVAAFGKKLANSIATRDLKYMKVTLDNHNYF